MGVVIIKSAKKNNKRIDGSKAISFGQKGASDFTKHGNTYRKDQCIDRHKAREYWTKSGVKAAGWMGKHVLWNKPTIQASIDDINKKFKSLNVKMNLKMI